MGLDLKDLKRQALDLKAAGPYQRQAQVESDLTPRERRLNPREEALVQRRRKLKIRGFDQAGTVEGLLALDPRVEALQRQLSRVGGVGVGLAIE